MEMNSVAMREWQIMQISLSARLRNVVKGFWEMGKDSDGDSNIHPFCSTTALKFCVRSKFLYS